MRRIILVVIAIITLFLGSFFIIAEREERRLMSHDRFFNEVGYSLPESSRIVDTKAIIWSIADGANYTWLIESSDSLLPWILSLGKLEYEQTYRVSATLPDGRIETSYISLGPGGKQATVKTFRP